MTLDMGEHEENQQICDVYHFCHVLTSKTTVAFTVISIYVKMWHLKVSGVAQLMTVKLLQIKCSVLGCIHEKHSTLCVRGF